MEETKDLNLGDIRVDQTPEYISLNEFNKDGFTWDVLRFLNKKPDIVVFTQSDDGYVNYPRSYDHALMDDADYFKKNFFVNKENFEEIKKEIEKIKEENKWRAANNNYFTQQVIDKRKIEEAERKKNSFIDKFKNYFGSNKVAASSGGRKKTRKSKKQRKNKSKRVKR